MGNPSSSESVVIHRPSEASPPMGTHQGIPATLAAIGRIAESE